MKLTLLLVILFGLQLRAELFSQEVNLGKNLNNVSVKQVLLEIEKNSEFVFIYPVEKVNKLDKVNISTEHNDLKDILDICLKNSDLEFKIIRNHIIICKEAPKPTVSEQKQIILKGVVTDKSGLPLPGVSVFIKGTHTGIATDIDGKFNLQIVDKKDAILVFSFVGMLTQEIKYTGQKELKVVMQDDSEQLEEVVVTGFQKLSKERVSGSFDKVDTKDIEKPVSNIQERLAAAVTGLQIVDDGFGRETIQIRGRTTIKGEDGLALPPLVVVDGFPVEGDLSAVNPNDIESIHVLKDAAAASIWGARAGNGVIVVTTKGGKKSSTTNVEFSSFWKFRANKNLNK